MNERMQLALDRSSNRPELNKGETKQFLPQAKLDGETEAQYVERLTAVYKAKASDATPPALMARALSFIQAMASKVFELPATEEMQAARLNTCYSCEFFQVAFDAPEQIGHCSTCGCGKGKMSSLSEKAKILKSSCPKGYWDVSISAAPDASPSFSPQAE
jgi:hypothetical protein